MDYIARIATLIGDPERTRFSASEIAGAYESASLRYLNEENRCYSAASELLTIDITKLTAEYAVKQDGTGVESDTMQDLSAIVSARKMQINTYNSMIVSERQLGSSSGFAVKARKVCLRGIND